MILKTRGPIILETDKSGELLGARELCGSSESRAKTHAIALPGDRRMMILKIGLANSRTVLPKSPFVTIPWPLSDRHWG